MRFRLYLPSKNVAGGNQITADRWVEMLDSLGHQAQVCRFSVDELDRADVNIFFNAAKSAGRIVKTKIALPDRPIVVVLSGTDLQDFRLMLPETQSAISAADALVVYEESAISRLPPQMHQRSQTVVVPHSCRIEKLPDYQFQQGLNIIAVSHIRPEKNLDRYFLCLKHFVDVPNLYFHHVGGTRDDQPAAEIQDVADEISNLRLHGEKSHDETLAMIRAADLLVHPSLVEGFPNVVVEAIVNGTPVALSRIDSHTTTFAGCLPGELFFDTDCGAELRDLLQTFVDDEGFRLRIGKACSAIANRFKPELERQGLLELLRRIGVSR